MGNHELEGCDHFQSLMVETSLPLNWSDLCRAEAHWDKCHECQSRFPHGRSLLEVTKKSYEAESKDNIRRIYHEFMGKKHLLSAEAGNYQNILIELARCAEAIQWELNSIHEICDGEFHILPVPETAEVWEDTWEDVRTELAPFIRSLNTDEQHFIFSVVLISETYGNSLLTGGNAIRTDNDLAAEHSLEELLANKQNAKSEVQYFSLLALVEKAADVYLQEYLRKIKLQDAGSVQSPMGNIQSIAHELRRDVKNELRDTLTAIRIEISKLYESQKSSAASYELDLRQKLTDHLYDQLATTTRRALQLAEYFYNLNKEPDGFAPAVNQLAKAYEYEFHIRITDLFTNELLRKGIRSYPPSGGDRPLIRKGQVPVRTLGEVGHYVKNDAEMKSFLVRNRLDPYAIACDTDSVKNVRNPVSHDSEGNVGHVETLRKLLLNGSSSAFAHLIASDEDS